MASRALRRGKPRRLAAVSAVLICFVALAASVLYALCLAADRFTSATSVKLDGAVAVEGAAVAVLERVAESRKVDEVPASRLLSDWEVASLGVTRSIISNMEKAPGGKIAFLFLTEGPLPLERLWSRFFDVGHLYHSQHSQALLLP